MFDEMLALMVFLGFVLLGSVNANAADIVDPMRPPGYLGAQNPNNKKNHIWQVSAILVSNDRRLAFVNKRLLGVGDTVDGARVKAIYGNAVELDINGRFLLVKPATKSVRRITQ